MLVPHSDHSPQLSRPVLTKMTNFQRLRARMSAGPMIASPNQETRSHQPIPKTASDLPNAKQNPDLQQENFRLFRALMKACQKDFSSMLGVANQKSYSMLETGASKLDERQAKRIESELKLPPGWFDRNNGDLLFLSNDEFLLIQEVRKSDRQAASSLIEMLKQVRVVREAL